MNIYPKYIVECILFLATLKITGRRDLKGIGFVNDRAYSFLTNFQKRCCLFRQMGVCYNHIKKVILDK